MCSPSGHSGPIPFSIGFSPHAFNVRIISSTVRILVTQSAVQLIGRGFPATNIERDHNRIAVDIRAAVDKLPIIMDIVTATMDSLPIPDTLKRRLSDT